MGEVDEVGMSIFIGAGNGQQLITANAGHAGSMALSGSPEVRSARLRDANCKRHARCCHSQRPFACVAQDWAAADENGLCRVMADSRRAQDGMLRLVAPRAQSLGTAEIHLGM